MGFRAASRRLPDRTIGEQTTCPSDPVAACSALHKTPVILFAPTSRGQGRNSCGLSAVFHSFGWAARPVCGYLFPESSGRKISRTFFEKEVRISKEVDKRWEVAQQFLHASYELVSVSLGTLRIVRIVAF